MVEIVDLQKHTRERQEAKALEDLLERQKTETGGTDTTNRVYEIRYKSGDTEQSNGVLMLTGAFFALGVPNQLDGSVDFNWAAPVESIDRIIALDDDDLTEDVG